VFHCEAVLFRGLKPAQTYRTASAIGSAQWLAGGLRLIGNVVGRSTWMVADERCHELTQLWFKVRSFTKALSGLASRNLGIRARFPESGIPVKQAGQEISGIPIGLEQRVGAQSGRREPDETVESDRLLIMIRRSSIVKSLSGLVRFCDGLSGLRRYCAGEPSHPSTLSRVLPLDIDMGKRYASPT
jgi:hypothetical protein